MVRYNRLEIRYLWDKGLCLVFCNTINDATGMAYFEDGTIGTADRSLSAGSDVPTRLKDRYGKYILDEYGEEEKYRGYTVNAVPTPGVDSMTFEV